jgi:hypothetical protein
MDNLQTIAQLFSERLFIIPEYQRGYAWEVQQCQDFIEDLELLPEGKQHFFGTLVIQEHDHESSKLVDRGGRAYTRHDIIDGQQRLTTVTLFLHAIQQEMTRLGGDVAEFTQELQRNYLWTTDRNKRPLVKLTLNQETQELFQQLILADPDSIPVPKIQAATRLLTVHAYLTDYLQTQHKARGEGYGIWLEALYFKIARQLLLVVYTVQSEAEAGIIFETMNNRGKPLTEMEKVKNYLLYLAGRLHLPDPHNLGVQINKTWQHIYQSLTAASLVGRGYEDQLLRVHWLMAYDYQTQNWDGSRSIKNHFDLRDYDQRHEELLADVQTYLESMVSATTAYCDIQRPNHPGAFANFHSQPQQYEQVVAASSRLVRVGSLATFLPLLIAARIKQNHETYLQTVDLCEKYAFRVYRWSNKRGNVGQSWLFRLGFNLYQGQDGVVVLDDLRRAILYYCPDKNLEDGFQEGANSYAWSGLKYFLYEYEQHLAQESGLAVLMPWDVLTQKQDSIEHILPQTMGSDGYWQTRFTPEDHKLWIHDIGNLTLTYNNSPLSNRSFPVKQAIYAESPLFIERQLKDNSEWGVAQLQARRDALKVWALERWHVTPPPPPEVVETAVEGRKNSQSKIRALAEKNGVVDIYDKVVALSEDGFGLRPYARYLALTPPTNRRFTLMNIEPKPGRLVVDVWATNIPYAFPITIEEIQMIIGSNYRFQVEDKNADDFLAMLMKLYLACGLTWR